MSESVPRAATWYAVSASRRGSAHPPDVPNQDAALVRQVPTAHGDVWVAAVADGHGGARYVRSDVGARTAVEAAHEVVAEALAGTDEPHLALRAAVPQVVARWREAVVAHERDHPFSDAEGARGAVPGPTAYGATLLVAVVGAHGVALAQVGDGDALVRSHGFATRPVPGDDRLVAGETTSLCLDTAVHDFRHALVPADADPDLVLLATDGYGNSFARSDWWHGLVDDVSAFVRHSGVDQVARDLPGWLEESARVGGDDVTAVLLVRDLLVEAPRTPVHGVHDVQAASVPAPRALDGVGDRPAPERPAAAAHAPLARTRELAGTTAGAPRAAGHAHAGRRRRVAWASAALVAVAGAVALAWTVWGPDGGQAPPADPVVPPPTVSTSGSPDEDRDEDRGEDRDGRRDRGRERDGKDTTPELEQRQGDQDQDQPPEGGGRQPPEEPRRTG